MNQRTTLSKVTHRAVVERVNIDVSFVLLMLNRRESQARCTYFLQLRLAGDVDPLTKQNDDRLSFQRGKNRQDLILSVVLIVFLLFRSGFQFVS